MFVGNGIAKLTNGNLAESYEWTNCHESCLPLEGKGDREAVDEVVIR